MNTPKISVGIVGSRTIKDYNLIKTEFLKLYKPEEVAYIVSGGAVGVDEIAAKMGEELGIRTKIFPAEWSKFGKQAGYLRNIDIVQNSDEILAYHDGISKGTMHSIKIAKEMNKKVTIILVKV